MRFNALIKTIVALMGAIMILLTVLSAVSAQLIIPDLQPVYPEYLYYEGHSGIPIVSGPYPRYYLAQRDVDVRFMHDDYNHFDDFIGYRDLDVYTPLQGRVDVLRVPDAALGVDLSQLESVDLEHSNTRAFSGHVYGRIPDDSIYRKHYNHEHPWDVETYDYYVYEPIQKTICPCQGSCQPRSICQATHCRC